jgi:hypothetical protein
MSTDHVDSGTRAATGADALRGRFTPVIGFVALMLVALSTPMAQSNSPSGEQKGVPIDELKRIYLSCDLAAMSGQLDTAAIMQCSNVYEELKQRAFGGDFSKMLAWSKARSSERNTGR